MPNLSPTLIDHSNLAPWRDDLIGAWLALEEPWDFHMTQPRTAYLAAQRDGVKVVLDGVAGDVVLGEGSQMARQIRAGRWLHAWKDAQGLHQFWGEGSDSALKQVLLAARGAFVPDALRAIRRTWRIRTSPALWSDSAVDPDFARRAGLFDSLQADRLADRPRRTGFAAERIWSWPRSGLTVGRERYDRVAGHFGVEPRDPYMDRRLLAFCLAVPMDQFQHGGWPKMIQRRAMAGLLPDAVRWRRGKEHLGSTFTDALMDLWPNWREPLREVRGRLASHARSELLAPVTWVRPPGQGLTPATDKLLQTALFLTALPSEMPSWGHDA